MRITSPHISIYKFPITAVSSICVRLTGLSLTGYYISLGLFCFYPKKNEVINKYKQLDPNLKQIINYSFVFPFTYHTLGGIRHFVWDKYPNLLNNNSVKRSSIYLFLSSSFITFISEKYLYNIFEKKII